ncbi:MAG: phosphotransferase [bacterium]
MRREPCEIALIVQAGGKGSRFSQSGEIPKVCQPYSPQGLEQYGWEDKKSPRWTLLHRTLMVGAALRLTRAYLTLPMREEWSTALKRYEQLGDKLGIPVSALTGTNKGWMPDAIMGIESAHNSGASDTLLLFGDSLPDFNLLSRAVSMQRHLRNQEKPPGGILITVSGGGDHFPVVDAKGAITSYSFSKGATHGNQIVGWIVPHESLEDMRRCSNMEELIAGQLATGKQWILCSSENPICINVNTQNQAALASQILTRHPSLWGTVNNESLAHPNTVVRQSVIEILDQKPTTITHIKSSCNGSVFRVTLSEEPATTIYAKYYSAAQLGDQRYARDVFWSRTLSQTVLAEDPKSHCVMFEDVEQNGKRQRLDVLLQAATSQEQTQTLLSRVATLLGSRYHSYNGISMPDNQSMYREHRDIPLGKSSGDFFDEEIATMRKVVDDLQEAGITLPSTLIPWISSFKETVSAQKKCLVHGDFNPWNIFLETSQPTSVSGNHDTVIDHEWTHYAPKEKDLANVLSHFSTLQTLQPTIFNGANPNTLFMQQYEQQFGSINKPSLQFYQTYAYLWNAWYHRFISGNESLLQGCLTTIDEILPREQPTAALT